jgi:periplasmic divalent cation tolerance protein
MTVSFVYITAPDKNAALALGRELVEQRLAACVNVLDSMTSLYWWQGEVQQSSEAVLMAKTRTELVEKLVERVKALHSYDCPCVVAWPIAAGNPGFLQWIADETR